MATSTIPREVEDILVELKYVAGLPPGKKYNFKQKSYSSAYWWTSKIYRTFWVDEDRWDTIRYLKSVVTRAVEIARDNYSWRDIICKHLTDMHDALINLKHVYTDEPTLEGEIDLLRFRIETDTLMNEFRHL